MPNIRWLLGLITALHRWLYRTTRGAIGHRAPLLGWRSLLLTHFGRRTGRAYTIPLLYIPDGERYVIIASNAGDARDPSWLKNLRARPDARVQAGAEQFPVKARIMAGEERSRLWRLLVANYHDYARYQRNTAREIPVVILERVG